MSPELKAEIVSALKEHLRVNGANSWHVVGERYPETFPDCRSEGSAGRRKLYRWIARIQRPEEATPAEKRDARASARVAAAEQLPAAPPPAYFTKYGETAKRNIDYLGVLARVHDDLEIMRAQSVTETEALTKIKNFPFFYQSIKGRMDMLNTAITIMREIWDMKLMDDFYSEVISIIADEIAPAEPAIARRVMERLQALNERRAMGPGAPLNAA